MHQFNNNLLRMDTTLTSTSNPTQKTKPLPQFIVKLHHILENPNYRKAIAWGSQSGQVCIINQRQLETTVLPQFFRHHKTESFVRQLNNYGFSKLPTTRVGEELRFRNPFFLKDNPKALKHIKRKSKKEQKPTAKPTEELPRTELSMNQLEDIVELAAELADLVRRYPAIRPELDRAFQIMNTLTSNHPSIKDKLEDEQIKADYNLFQSLRGGQLDHVKLVSTCSFDDGLELEGY